MGEFIGGLIVAGILLGISIGFESFSCHSRWDNNKAISAVSYGPIKGCMIQTKDGWIPAENFRVF